MYSLQSLKRRARAWYGAAMAGLVFAASTANAAMITSDILHEAALDAIFSQASFGTHPIDIRFDPLVHLTVATNLLDLNTDTELVTLFNLGPSAQPRTNLFFVNSITSCGGASGNIIGCAATPGNVLAVQATFADRSDGAALIAHELGHNLGLDHVVDRGNLMNPIFTDATNLTLTQVTTMLASDLVQFDAVAQQRFIRITPIVISAIPLPISLPLFLSALIALGVRPRRSSESALTHAPTNHR